VWRGDFFGQRMTKGGAGLEKGNGGVARETKTGVARCETGPMSQCPLPARVESNGYK
jgi:hypothetical protein